MADFQSACLLSFGAMTKPDAVPDEIFRVTVRWFYSGVHADSHFLFLRDDLQLLLAGVFASLFESILLAGFFWHLFVELFLQCLKME